MSDDVGWGIGEVIQVALDVATGIVHEKGLCFEGACVVNPVEVVFVDVVGVVANIEVAGAVDVVIAASADANGFGIGDGVADVVVLASVDFVCVGDMHVGEVAGPLTVAKAAATENGQGNCDYCVADVDIGVQNLCSYAFVGDGTAASSVAAFALGAVDCRIPSRAAPVHPLQLFWLLV